MSTLIIVARIVAKPENRAFVESELIKLIEPTRSEPGCISYDLLQDNENENLYLFYENWESYDLWQQHMGAEPLARYAEATKGMIDEFVVNQMTQK